MARQSFFSRLLHGRLNRWEQTLVGGVTGLICALMLTVAVVLTSPMTGSPDALTIPEAALIFGSMGAIAGAIIGASATVSPDAWDHHETSIAQPKAKEQTWIVAFVWPRKNSTPESLRALGQELEAWRVGKTSVTLIDDLDRLLSGRYPLPEGPTPYVEDPEGEPMPFPRFAPDGRIIEVKCCRMSVVDPWLYCPVVVWASEGMTSDEAIESLRQTITPDLVRGIDYAFPM